jgi:hypothetical protein
MRFKLGGKLSAAIGLGIIGGIVGAVVSTTAASATTNTISVGSTGALTSRILIEIPVTVVCDPLPNSFVDDSVSITVEQANGKQVSTASGTVGSFEPAAPTLICDGVTQNTMMVPATPNPGSGPFHGGSAVVTIASFSYQTGIIFGPGSFEPTNTDIGFISNVVVSLRG